MILKESEKVSVKKRLRFKNHAGVHCNAQVTTALLHKYAEPDDEGPMVQGAAH